VIERREAVTAEGRRVTVERLPLGNAHWIKVSAADGDGVGARTALTAIADTFPASVVGREVAPGWWRERWEAETDPQPHSDMDAERAADHRDAEEWERSERELER